ncbi:GntR family transcriptional regulator [Embleya hyalina]|uniref:GntR family transcriptional regulator n=1 Tax=Embleya hyalina TaxID=516124 RepID=A0A401Z3Y2_9ACTN|nr:GntR family transcriptional regulator [Embleya hyalina]GCE01546.1 GntR family transcriptional regulator [Embleya hyalina]
MTSSSRHLYQQIADDIRAQIADGTLVAGDQLPTEAELQERYDTSRHTARTAIAHLVQEGLVISRRPRGHFVRERRPMVYRPQSEFKRKPPELDIFMTLMADDGRMAAQDIDVAIVEGSPDVRQRLQLADGELAAVRRRVRKVEGEPYNINDSYFRLSDVQGSEIMHPANVERGTNQVMDELGIGQAKCLDEIYVRMPTPDESHRLQLLPGTPVAVHIVTGFDGDERPVQCVVNVLAGDRHVIVYERIRPQAESNQ